MEIKDAIERLSALAQESRLETYRMLVAAGSDGMLAGEIAERLAMRQNTLSTHLGTLSRAGLITGSREGRGIRYRAEIGAMQALISFLMEDCCGGRPEICLPLLEKAMPT